MLDFVWAGGRKFHRVGVLCAAVSLLALGSAEAQTTYLPSIKIGTAALISPSAGNSYYYSQTGWTDTNVSDGLSAYTHKETPIPPEITELTRALKGDPDLIYQYVHNNIQTVWMYGLQKGALGAEIDKSGTPFDQAQLMVALLQKAGYTANYFANTVVFNAQQFQAWTGISSARAACQLLANGGIPAAINGTTGVTCASFDPGLAVTSVQMAHVWVQVTIPGSHTAGCASSDVCVFDPSYKTYNYKTGIPLATAMGLTPGTTLTHAMAGAGTGHDSVGGGAPVNYVQTLNAGNLNGDLQTYASNLLSYIKTNKMQGAQIEDIVGGGVIVPDNSTLRQVSLPYADPHPPYLRHIWTPVAGDPARYNAIPDQYRTVLTVEAKTQHVDSTDSVEMFSPTPLFVDEIYGRRLSIETDFTAAGIGTNQNNYYHQYACIALDAQPWVTWPSAQCLVTYSYVPPGNDDARSLPVTVILSANHPYSTSADGTPTTNGDYMDATVTKPVKAVTSLSIVHGWGDTSAALFNKWSGEKVGDSALPTLNTAPKCPGGEGGEGDLCPALYAQPNGEFSRDKAAGAWLAQFSRAAKLNASMVNAVPQIHHSLGVVFGEVTLTGVLVNPEQPSGFIVGDNFDRIDVDSGISVSSRTSDSTAPGTRRGAIMALAAASAALEGSISGQLTDVVDMSSTTTRFEWGNSPDPDHTATGQNPFGIGPQKFYQYDLTNYAEAAGAPGPTPNGLSRVDGGASGSCNGSVPIPWSSQPTLTNYACYGQTGGTTPATLGLTGNLGAWIGDYATQGFTVIASQEAFLGPGQRGGQINPNYGPTGSPTSYYASPSQQRGGAFVALKLDANGDPVEIAHIIIGGSGITKGGGGGSQPDEKTTYDPGTAADILKSRFVDRSKLLGVDLANGSLGETNPVSISIGNGGFPFELSAGSSWHPGPLPENFSPQSPIAPQPGWDNSWFNSMTFSGSGMEAMGQSDIRGALGAVVSFYTAQDIYQSAQSPGRDVVGVLTQSWWAHQLSGNIASVNIGGNTRQFVKIATGDWIEPGAGYATALQTNPRVPYSDKCYHTTLESTPYAVSRGWDTSNVSFAATNAQGDTQSFEYFENLYYLDDVHKCGKLKGFRLKAWTFPYGVTITPAYALETVGDDQFYALTQVSNSLGRSLSFSGTTVSAGTRSIDLGGILASASTDAMSFQTSFAYQGAQAQSDTQRPVPYSLLASITTPEHPSQPNVAYTYDSLGRIMQVQDAVAIQQGTRGPYNFLIADGTRGERDDPLSQPYVVGYDTYGHPYRYIDELGFETDALFDSRSRALQYVYPEGDCEAFAYDDQNNTTDFWKVDKTSSCNTGAGPSHVLHTSAVWDPGWNKPLQVFDANGNKTTLAYYSSGTGASLLQTATRPAITEGTPVYTFTYDGFGRALDLTGPTGIVTHSDYDATTHYLTATTLDYSTGTGHQNLKTQFGTDTDGNVNLTIDPRLNATTTVWDANRRKVEDDHHMGNFTANINAAEKMLYDQINRVTDDQAGTAFSGTTVTTWLTTKHTTYTPTSKVATVTDADNRVTTTAYDNGDRMLTVTDPVSRKMHFVYCKATDANCAANQVKTEYRSWVSGIGCSSPTSLQECYRRVTYFADGEERSLEDANSNITSYGYDGWNRLVLTTFPDTTTEQLTPDADGNITKRITRANQEIDYLYNTLNWMTQKTTPVPSTLVVSWQYLLDGRIDVLQDNATAPNIVDYGYDSAGRMNQVKTKIGGFNTFRTVNYTLDKNSNRTNLQWPTQDAAYAVGYCYDNLNRMTQAQENATDCTSGLLATYAYDPLSRRTSVTYGNGTGASMSYLSYTNAGDLQTLTHTFPGGTSNNNTFSYTYTNAHQTNTIAASNAAFFWQPTVNASTAYTPNILNQYSAIGSQTTGGTNCQGAAQGLSYDCNGNLTFDGTLTYAYDAENRLLNVTNASHSIIATYAYDPLGRRVEKLLPGGNATYFLSDGTDEIAEYNSGKTVVTRYIPGPAIDEPIATQTVSGGAKEYFHTDKQGSVVAMSDGSGNLVEGPYTYDAYGNCFNGSSPCGTSGEPYRFTGRRFDPETGLYYYRARYYDPAKGRFLQTDPVGYTADLNLYTYGGNDPTDKVDPNGNRPLLGTLDILKTPEQRLKDDELALEISDKLNVLGASLMGLDGIGAPFEDLAGWIRAGALADRTIQEGIIYRRTNLADPAEKPYIGQAKSEERFEERQKEHGRANPDAVYKFEQVERAKPGSDLNKAEQRQIDAHGGPTNKSNPNGGTSNRRNAPGSGQSANFGQTIRVEGSRLCGGSGNNPCPN